MRVDGGQTYELAVRDYVFVVGQLAAAALLALFGVFVRFVFSINLKGAKQPLTHLSPVCATRVEQVHLWVAV